MDQDTDKRLAELEKKVDDMSAILKKLWTSYKWALWITIALIVLPLIGLMFAIPLYVKTLDLNSLVP